MNNEIFNYIDDRKLPEYFKDFLGKKVTIIGCGAIGGYVAEMLAKMGVVRQTLIDFDPFEHENAVKTTCLYRVPKDSGKNKAKVLAERLNDLIGEECVHGIDANITCFGPMAFADQDVIILALDNYASKIYGNQDWMQIPKDRKPLMIFGGTIGECAHSNCLDGSVCCIRCLFDEKWLTNPLVRTSCTGPNYRIPDLPAEFARTTALASMESAIQIAETCRAFFLGYDGVVNMRTVYSAHPALNLSSYMPMRRRSCPDCKEYQPVENVKALENIDVLHNTVGDLMDAVSAYLENTDFEILVSRIEFGNARYSKIIVDDYCKCCGRELKQLYRHEFRSSYENQLCEECKNLGKKADESLREDTHGTCLSAICKDNCNKVLRGKILFDVGYRIGEIIWVIQRGGGLDCMDSEIKYYPFYCENDQKIMNAIDKLEG